MNFVAFEPRHITLIDGQEQQDYEAVIQPRTIEYGKYLLASGPAISGVVGDEVIFCGGFVQAWPHRFIVWAVLSKNAHKYLIRITKGILRAAELHRGAGRFELIVRAGFEEGRRWAELLGFKYNNFEQGFLPDRSDAFTYVRFL
jgi:hypothetical protein